MNITSGYETMPYAFNGIVAGSLLLGGGFRYFDTNVHTCMAHTLDGRHDNMSKVLKL
jgi:hypothetical protein